MPLVERILRPHTSKDSPFASAHSVLYGDQWQSGDGPWHDRSLWNEPTQSCRQNVMLPHASYRRFSARYSSQARFCTHVPRLPLVSLFFHHLLHTLLDLLCPSRGFCLRP